MSSTQSFNDSLSDDGMENTQCTRVGSTPRTPLSPHDTFPKDCFEQSKENRRSSFVRFHGLNPSSENELPSSSVATSKDTGFPSLHEAVDVGKSSSLSHAEILNRFNDLEDRFHNLELSRHLSSSDKGDDSSERTGLSTEIQ
jgi:hypothetical protein